MNLIILAEVGIVRSLTQAAARVRSPRSDFMLKLKLRGSSPLPIETPGLTVDACRGVAVADLERRQAWHGKQRTNWGELFHISGNAEMGVVELSEEVAGGLRGLHYLGAEQRSGLLVIVGDCGRHVASQMYGGVLRVEGDAGDWAGAEMRGGALNITGDAANYVGSAYRGSTFGMRGGAILVHGNAGLEVGHGMRRGLVGVGGFCGDFAGVDMAAGSIVSAGGFGRRAGAGMRRGTLLSFAAEPPELLPTFTPAGDADPLILQLLLRELAQLGLPISEVLREAMHLAEDLPRYDVWHGDRLFGGRGEVIWRKAA